MKAKNYSYKNSPASICFDCKKALGGCSWSELDPETWKPRFVLPLGAEATPTTIRQQGHGKDAIHTFHISSCPEFMPDEPRTIELSANAFLNRARRCAMDV